MTPSTLRVAACVTVLLGCADVSTIALCDIRESSCQEDVFLAVQAQRSNAWDPWLDMPPMRVISQDQYRRELQAQRDAYDAQEPPFDHVSAALKLLHMIDPTTTSEDNGSIDARVSNIAAYYSPQTKDVTIIDRGDVDTLEKQVRILAHELTHAAQDRDTDLFDRFSVSTISNSHARSALIEGEATLYANLVWLDASGVGPREVDWNSYHQDWLDNQRDDVIDSASPWFQTAGLVYPLGSRLMIDTWLDGGNVAVRSLFTDPPQDIVQLFDTPLGPASLNRLDCDPPSAPDGFDIKSYTAMGALEVFGFISRLDVQAAPWTVARGWRGDRFVVYSDDAEHTIVVWQIKLNHSASEVAAAARALLGDDAVLLDDDQVRIMLSDTTVPPGWTEWQRCVTR